MLSGLTFFKFSKRVLGSKRGVSFWNNIGSRCLSMTSPEPPDPRPHVEAPLSYTFGKSKDALRYKTIGMYLEERVANETGQPMIISHHEGIQRTFTDFHEDVNRIANTLTGDLGLRRGEVVALWGCNTYRWLTIQYACARVGLILCTINPYYQKGELLYALKKGDVRALFMPGQGSIQEGVNPFGGILFDALALENGQKDDEDKLLLDYIINFDGQPYSDVPSARSISTYSLDGLLPNKSSDLSASITESVSPDDGALLVLTSGTTGKPKGALLSHFTLTNNSRLYYGHILPPNGSPEILSNCIPLPFFHAFAGVLGCIALTTAPFRMIIPYLKYSASELVKALNTHQATHMIATPTLVIDLMETLKRTSIQVPSLRCIMAGGASMPVQIARQFLDTVPSVTDLRICYGATEMGPVSTINKSWYTLERRIESVGTAADFTELKIIHPESGVTVECGVAGELCSRGYNTMMGYWKDPARTAEVIDSSGWYNSGDLATMDEEGFVRIVGRTKEMIIVGGENVYPKEIEELLHTHPAILDAYVFGIPDARKGEEVCTWIKLKDAQNAVGEEELKAFCKDNLAYFKVPKRYFFVDEFPLTSVGKAKKFVMRQMTVEKLGL